MKRAWMVFVCLPLLLLLAACAPTGIGAEPELYVRDAWSRPAAAGGSGAIFFVIDNPTAQGDVLLSAKSDAAMMVELHKSTMDSAGVMKMEKQDKVDVPANGQVELKPGGLHVMMMNLTRDLKEGDTLTAVLTFQNAGEVTIAATVKME